MTKKDALKEHQKDLTNPVDPFARGIVIDHAGIVGAFIECLTDNPQLQDEKINAPI